MVVKGAHSVAIAPNSVAVLPFDYATSNPNESYLGPGPE